MMKSKVIVPTRVEVEERSGTQILVVEDGNKEEYTTADPYLVNWAEKYSDRVEDKYIGERWRIAFSITEDGFKDFEGFLSKAVNETKKEDVDDKLENLDERVTNLEKKLAEVTENE